MRFPTRDSPPRREDARPLNKAARRRASRRCAPRLPVGLIPARCGGGGGRRFLRVCVIGRDRSAIVNRRRIPDGETRARDFDRSDRPPSRGYRSGYAPLRFIYRWIFFVAWISRTDDRRRLIRTRMCLRENARDKPRSSRTTVRLADRLLRFTAPYRRRALILRLSNDVIYNLIGSTAHTCDSPLTPSGGMSDTKYHEPGTKTGTGTLDAPLLPSVSFSEREQNFPLGGEPN